MRKTNPADICQDFRDEISELEVFLKDSMKVSESSKNQSLISEVVFHRGYVAVESFLSAWIIGAINRDSSRYFQARENSIKQSLEAKYSSWDVGHIKYSPPVHIRMEDLKDLIDPDGWNITFKTFDKLELRCADWLAPSFLNKVRRVSSERREIIDAAKSIRNCIAHQSQGSFSEMNEKVGSLSKIGVSKHLQTSVNSVKNVGAHLKAKVGGKMRVQHYLDEFCNLGFDLM
ncbi:hypothetical protein [Kushneria sp. EE4]